MAKSKQDKVTIFGTERVSDTFSDCRTNNETAILFVKRLVDDTTGKLNAIENAAVEAYHASDTSEMLRLGREAWAYYKTNENRTAPRTSQGKVDLSLADKAIQEAFAKAEAEYLEKKAALLASAKNASSKVEELTAIAEAAKKYSPKEVKAFLKTMGINL